MFFLISGKILTIETVPLKLPRRYWDGPEVDPDQTFFPDEYLRHILYITRIYFISGEPEEELIGKLRFILFYFPTRKPSARIAELVVMQHSHKIHSGKTLIATGTPSNDPQK